MGSKKKDDMAWKDDLIKDQNEVISELRDENKILSLRIVEISNDRTRKDKAIERLKELLNGEQITHTNTKGKLKETELSLEAKEVIIKQLIKESKEITIWSLLFKSKKGYLWRMIETHNK